MIYKNILEAMGNTPLIKLGKITSPDMADVLVKFEGTNVGGSIKTRSAYNMVIKAEEQGILKEGSTIVEATSGNQGIGLALIGAVRGYKTVIILPDSVSEERAKLIRHYGAEAVTVHDDGDIGKCIEECSKLALDMKAKDPNVFIPSQFENPANPEINYSTTAVEILRDCGKNIDGFCSGIGTGGTITGIGKKLKEEIPGIVIWAAEPENAAILSGGKVSSHIQMGIGDGIIPAILDTDLIDDITIVSDEEAVAMARRLASEEGIMCGISSGSNVVAALRLAGKLGKGKTVVTILPDTAERYFSTELFAD
ncbi:MAG: cysteine synthase A [Saccharofermentans sp.]|nr:cysteine synthase A [Saccharofermentans sp.]